VPLGFEPRPTCARCLRPKVVCYCAAIAPLETRTRVVFLQHPREEQLGIGTARMASLCLPSSELHVGLRFSGSPALLKAIDDPERPAYLLFPGPDAIDVATAPPTGPITLIVVDGTWAQAKKIVRSTPELAALPRYTFIAPAPSNYRIRRPPRLEYLSTIESMAHVLGVIEGDPTRFLALHAPFQKMVEAQLEYARTSRVTRHRRTPKPKKAPSPPKPPAILQSRWDDLVCVAAESNAWSLKSGLRTKGTPGDLVHCVAFRPSTGERFEMFVAPRLELCPDTADLLEVPPEALSAGRPREAFQAAWRAFTRPSDVLIAWGLHGFAALAAGGVDLPESCVDLRKEGRMYLMRPIGPLHAFVGLLGASTSADPIGTGRAGRRLALLTTATKHLAVRPAPT
jgi:DTW domain-containing protein